MGAPTGALGPCCRPRSGHALATTGTCLDGRRRVFNARPQGSRPPSGQRLTAGTGRPRCCDAPPHGLRFPKRNLGPVGASRSSLPAGLFGLHRALYGAGADHVEQHHGVVGLSAVIAAKLLGAEQIILMGRHTARTDLGREFGATDVVAARGEEGIATVRDLTGGHGTDRVLECVGLKEALVQSAGVVRDGGVISRVGAPQYAEVPLGFPEFLRNITLTGGVAPARAYIEDLVPHILSGAIHPGRVFDRTVPLKDVAEGYRLMNDREALKVAVRP